GPGLSSRPGIHARGSPRRPRARLADALEPSWRTAGGPRAFEVLERHLSGDHQAPRTPDRAADRAERAAAAVKIAASSLKIRERSRLTVGLMTSGVETSIWADGDHEPSSR